MNPSAPTARPGATVWRAVCEHPLAIALLVLLPAVFLAPLPLDETRYLAVAWEMRQGGDLLVPHLNGAPYPHKPPLLFWLINAGWLVTGVHAWTARALSLGCSLASVLLLGRLARRLTGSAKVARLSMWFFAGIAYFALFANAIMFDVLLATCVLLAVHGVCDLADGRMRRGIVILAVAIGLGVLAKGPVMLLDVAFVGLLAPWWHPSRLAGRRLRHYTGFLLAVLLGAGIALAWAVPAAFAGGTDYAQAVFLNQTLDRIEGVEGASVHARPWWWYLAMLPLLLLPWVLVMRGAWRRLPTLLGLPALRLAAAWFVPTLLVFSLVAGKQAHYLLPLFPAFALALALAVERGVLEVRAQAFGLFLLLMGVALAVVPHTSPQMQPALRMLAPGWGLAVAAIGLALLALARQARTPVVVTMAALTLALVIRLAIGLGTGTRYDVGPVANQVRAAQQQGQGVASLGWHHGVYEFAGRLQRPVPALFGEHEIVGWARRHPDGLLVGFSKNVRLAATPAYRQEFRGGELCIWHARDALAAGLVPPAARSRDPSAARDGTCND
ncbi:ArnT family glycosyltransferase [Dokdonella sp.]|uniref:ArnT family glycosyltransferase n=1 Tax=Dokdonella sp. TaxID=2291710 RepID=UPI0031BF2DC6|nr:glycosyltransferase family 39 protein [Dokdonella sp.]